MAKKPNKVELVVKAHSLSQSLEINHAERLLRMPNNGGWELPENSEYEFDLNNGLRLKSNKRDSESTSK